MSKKHLVMMSLLSLTLLTGCRFGTADGNASVSVKDGVDGTNGATFLTGDGAPTKNIGNDGDYYLDNATYDLYLKTSGLWSKVGNIKGADGTDGKDGTDGHTPVITIGENGNWYVDGVDTGKKASKDVTEYAVAFDTDGGSLPSGYENVIRVTKGESILDLPTPTKQDYIFDGWYVNDGVNQSQFLATTPVTSNITLKAKWKPVAGQVFTITWLNYDGTLLGTSTNVLYNTYPSYTGDTPVKPSDGEYDYTFSSWSPKIVAAKEDSIYVAQYTKQKLTYTVTFDMQGKGNLYGDTIQNGKYTGNYGDVISLRDFKITYNTNAGDNYIADWYYDENLTKKVSFPFVVTKAMTLYPEWKANTNQFSYTYDEENNGYVLRSFLNVSIASEKTIRIPSTYDDGEHGSLPVISMRDTFRGITSIETVILPDSMTSIGAGAFCNSSLKYVTLPANITKIPESCFRNTDLQDITLNDEITEIGDYAFESTKLTSIELPSQLKYIRQNAFCRCEKISYVKFPSTLEEVDDCAFNSCSALKKVDTNNGLKKIGGYAFEYCGNLESFVIPSTLTSLSGYVPFRGDSNLCLFFEFESCPFSYMDLGNGPTVFYLSETDPGTKEGNYWHYVDGVPTKW